MYNRELSKTIPSRPAQTTQSTSTYSEASTCINTPPFLISNPSFLQFLFLRFHTFHTLHLLHGTHLQKHNSTKQNIPNPSSNTRSMHFQLPLILAMAATALASPTANQATSNLEKRWHHGWIGSFSDPQCTGPETGPRPELHLNDCTGFTPANTTGYFGIYFGTGIYGYDELGVFSDTGCQNSIMGPGFGLDKLAWAVNGFACVGVDEVDSFGSVMAGYSP